MEKTDELYKTEIDTHLGKDNYYYKYVFKKTEKIVCAVFYLLSKADRNAVLEQALSEVSKEAGVVHNYVLDTLTRPSHQLATIADTLAHHLLVLESKLRVLTASGGMDQAHFAVFHNEIDSVIRTVIQHSRNTKSDQPLEQLATVSAPTQANTGLHTTARTRPDSTPRVVSTPVAAQQNKQSRRERIIELLGSKGQASIKDLSEVIKDCSEKTIQRELTTLIKDNIVRREGERRWSVYQLT